MEFSWVYAKDQEEGQQKVDELLKKAKKAGIDLFNYEKYLKNREDGKLEVYFYEYEDDIGKMTSVDLTFNNKSAGSFTIKM